MPQDFSIIITCHKEGKKPLKLFKSIEASELCNFNLSQIYVVTTEAKKIASFSRKVDLPVKIIMEGERKGKARAVNLALKEVATELVVLLSGDILVSKGAINKMLQKLDEKEVGIVTCRPVPEGENGTFIDYFHSLIWRLHHFVSKEDPKAGEAIAFENLIDSFPEDTAADEEFIKKLILNRGYKAVYASKAKVFNEAPKNLFTLFKQRRRIHIGHLDLQERTNYSPPSMNFTTLSKSILRFLREDKPHPYFLASLFFEKLARISGWLNYHLFNKNPYKWDKRR